MTAEENAKAVGEIRTILKERIELLNAKTEQERKKIPLLTPYDTATPESLLRTSIAMLGGLAEIYGLLDMLFDFALQVSNELEELSPYRAKESREKFNEILKHTKTFRFVEYLEKEHQEPTEKVDDSDKPKD